MTNVTRVFGFQRVLPAAVVAAVCVCSSWAMADDAAKPKATPAKPTAPPAEGLVPQPVTYATVPGPGVPYPVQPAPNAPAQPGSPVAEPMSPPNTVDAPQEALPGPVTYAPAQVTGVLVVPAQEKKTIGVFRVHRDLNTVVHLLDRFGAHNIAVYTADADTNSILAQGTDKSLEEFGDIIKKLDAVVSEDASSKLPITVRVRIVWLAEGLSGVNATAMGGEGTGPGSMTEMNRSDQSGTAPAEDMKGVVDELGRMGFKDVRQVGQAMVNTRAKSGAFEFGLFQISCSPFAKQIPASLAVQGCIAAESRPGVFSLQANVKSSFGGGEAELQCNLQIRQDKYVVLGVAPSGPITSIFVLQITPVELD